jgi:hypothetical protein
MLNKKRDWLFTVTCPTLFVAMTACTPSTPAETTPTEETIIVRARNTNTPTPPPTGTPIPTPTFTLESTVAPELSPTPTLAVDHSPALLSGSGVVQVTFGDDLHYTPALSPDQQRMVISVRIGQYWQLVEADHNGQGVLRQITNAPFNFYHPQFTADGQQILVASDRDGGHMDIYLLDFATGEVLQQLTNTTGDNYAPRWLPDYTGFVFTST